MGFQNLQQIQHSPIVLFAEVILTARMMFCSQAWSGSKQTSNSLGLQVKKKLSWPAVHALSYPPVHQHGFHPEGPFCRKIGSQSVRFHVRGPEGYQLLRPDHGVLGISGGRGPHGQLKGLNERVKIIGVPFGLFGWESSGRLLAYLAVHSCTRAIYRHLWSTFGPLEV